MRKRQEAALKQREVMNTAAEYLTDAQASTKRWHGIFYSNSYVVTNMAQRYSEESPAKQAQLDKVLDEWAKLS